MPKRKLNEANELTPEKLPQIDFISSLVRRGVPEVAEKILSYLDGPSLARAEAVCQIWRGVILNCDRFLWGKLLERNVQSDSLWRSLGTRRGWIENIRNQSSEVKRSEHFYRNIYFSTSRDLWNLDQNWKSGRWKAKKIEIPNDEVERLSIDDCKIVCQLQSGAIKIWDIHTLECIRTIANAGSFWCLEFHDNIVMGGLGDSTLKWWEIDSGVLVHSLKTDGIITDLCFDQRLLLTRAFHEEELENAEDPEDYENKSPVAVWDIRGPKDIHFRQFLQPKPSTYYKFQFDQNFIVCLTDDGDIDVWSTLTCQYLRTLESNSEHFPYSFHYRYPHVIIGNSHCDESPTGFCLWDVETGAVIEKVFDADVHWSLNINRHKILYTTNERDKIKIRDLNSCAWLCTVDHEEFCCFHSVEASDFLVFSVAMTEDYENYPIVVWDFLDAGNE